MTSIGGEKDSIDRICALWFQNGKYVHSPVQGCQIFLCATYQNRGKYGHKIYQMAANIMAIKYTETVHYGTLKNLPQLDFWSENIHTIWQPWSGGRGSGIFIIALSAANLSHAARPQINAKKNSLKSSLKITPRHVCMNPCTAPKLFKQDQFLLVTQNIPPDIRMKHPLSFL
jgi:hypothetical protein